MEIVVSHSRFFDNDASIEAALWSQRISGDSTFDADAFGAWLEADPLHAQALAEIETACALLDVNRDLPAVLALRHEARREAMVVQTSAYKRQVVSKRLLLGAIAASIVVLFGTSLQWWPHEVRYETKVGERRTIVLSDGSKIDLDTASSIKVAYGMNVRRVSLFKGRAHFRVQKDRSRPFTVEVDEKTVQAVGTAFTVDRLDKHIIVTLVEGRVRIGTGHRTNLKWIKSDLQPGEQAVLTHGSEVMKVSRLANSESATGWLSGMLTFDDEPLMNVVARMNTYSESKIVIYDKNLRAMHVSGSFPAKENDMFVKALESYYPIRSRHEENQIVLESRQDLR